MIRRWLVQALMLGVLVSGASAILSARQFPAPLGWKWVLDSNAKIVTTLDPPEGSWLFGTMAPGWHVTSRPGVILFEPTHSARGRFVLESESFLFPGTSAAGFGVFVGGTVVTFLVNGQKVADVPRDGGRFDGVVGLRVGENLNLHVTNLDLTHRLALPRRSK